MRPSPKHRLIGLAITLSLGSAVALPLSAAANASLIGEVVAPVTIKVGSLLTVETAPTPKVEVPGVATVQVPTVPSVQVPVPPVTVTTPSVPPVTKPSLPTTSAPVSTTPIAPAPSGEVGASTSGTSARAAGTSIAASAGSGPAAGSAQAGSTNGHVAPASARGRRTSRRGAIRGGDKQATAAAPSSGQRAADSSAPAVRAASSTKPDRSTGRDPSGKTSSSNPLDRIGRQIPFPVPVPDWSKPIILLLLLLAAWFAAHSRLAALRARRLERQRAVLLGDLGSMQAALVPEIPAQLGDVSVSVAYRPAEGPAAGGDFYDLFVLEPGKVAIVLGDVAGHGRDALTQAALTRYTLRAYMQAGLEPRAALSLAGSVLAEPGELRFATVIAAIYDTVNGRLTYASAGHDPPISIGFDTPEPPTVCCSAPVGCNLPTGRRQTTISIPAGGKVCFFSDGLPEARTADGLLGRERLVALVRELDAGEGAPALLERVRGEALRTPDDMVACIVAAAVGADAPAAPVEELEVDRAALDGAHVPVFLRVCGLSATSVARSLARARELVEQDGTALLRIERSDVGEPTVAALRGLSSASSRAAIGRASEARALALR
jgi:hypothetical protein